VGIQEEFRKVVDSFDSRHSGREDENLTGETDFGLTEATPDDIPTRVKAPDPKPRQRPRSSSKQELYLNTIKENIEEQLNDAGVIAGEYGLSTAGYVICDGSQQFSNAIVEMARNRPRLLKALEKTGKGANVSKIMKYFLAIAFAVMVDMETRDPYSFQMKYLGVQKAYEATHPDGPATGQGVPVFTPTAPPNFG